MKRCRPESLAQRIKGCGFTFALIPTLKGRNINLEEDLYDATQDDVVPSGVAELSNLQIQGYTYIKP